MMVKCDNDYLRCKDSLSYAKSKEKGLQNPCKPFSFSFHAFIKGR